MSRYVSAGSYQNRLSAIGAIEGDTIRFEDSVGRFETNSLLRIQPASNPAEIVLRGDSAATLGEVRFQSPIDFDDVSAAVSLNPYFIQANPSQTFTAGFVGGGYNISPTINFSNSLFIWEGGRIAPNITSGVAPAFAAFTLLNALPVLRSTTAGFAPLNALTLNVGAVIENGGVAIALTTASNFGMNFAAQTRTTGAFGTMTVTDQKAVNCSPTFSTVATSVVNLGTIKGLHCRIPAVALFQPAAGTENMTAYIGLDYDNMAAFGGNVTKVAVRSAQAAATNAYFLQHTGNAQSVLGGQLRFDSDLTGITFGASQDINMGWAGASNELFFNFLSSGDDLRLGNPSANRLLLQGDIQATELNMNFDRFSLGAQSGAVGNQVGVFVTPARTAAINGSWADFLLTHSGNITINATLSDLSAWVINPVAITSGTGSITGFVAGLQVGQTNSSLGGADTMALRNNGRLHQRGVAEFPPLSPSALTGNVNDYAPATGAAMRQIWRVTSDDLGARTVTGVAVQQSNDTQWITNIGTVDNIVLSHQDVASTATNRIISNTGANLTLGPDESALLWHDDVTDRWRVLYTTGA